MAPFVTLGGITVQAAARVVCVCVTDLPDHGPMIFEKTFQPMYRVP